MKSLIATVETKNARRYLQQLCTHWGQQFTIIFNEHRGTIDFGDGQAVELSATEEFLGSGPINLRIPEVMEI